MHQIVEPEGLPPARGFSHGILAETGRTVWVAGQIASDAEGRVVGGSWAEQFDLALGNVLSVLTAAGARPEHIVSVEIFTTDVSSYRTARPTLAGIYRAHMGDYYPAMALLGVTELVEPDAVVEITATAVIPAVAAG